MRVHLQGINCIDCYRSNGCAASKRSFRRLAIREVS